MASPASASPGRRPRSRKSCMMRRAVWRGRQRRRTGRSGGHLVRFFPPLTSRHRRGPGIPGLDHGNRRPRRPAPTGRAQSGREQPDTYTKIKAFRRRSASVWMESRCSGTPVQHRTPGAADAFLASRRRRRSPPSSSTVDDPAVRRHRKRYPGALGIHDERGGRTIHLFGRCEPSDVQRPSGQWVHRAVTASSNGPGPQQ
ncbi:hypothetical protein HBB16_19750 [Pseudonocardia sp. MCCB 268]|nr:hypothetical protein [Pseudonocardia cytotoxica]